MDSLSNVAHFTSLIDTVPLFELSVLALLVIANHQCAVMTLSFKIYGPRLQLVLRTEKWPSSDC